jgi:septum formation protein
VGWFYFFCLVGAGKADVRKVILVSRSPRRQALIRVLGHVVEVMEPPDEEGGVEGLMPPQAAMTLAMRKVRWALPLPPGGLAIGADTVVVVEEEVLGKPRTLEEAYAFLRRLSGRWHWVYTGVAIAWGEKMRVFYEGTAVRFHKLSEGLIKAYLETKSSLDKAGAYGAQDLIGLVGIAEIKGDFYNVMGLPMQRIYREGIKLLGGDWIGEEARGAILG